jgi:broad specificity phosphatase PhoE
MKKVLLACMAMLCINLLQAQTNTYILIRHAEKDTSALGSTMMTADPPLSKEGEQRAIKLISALKSYTIDSIYSTNYTRTKNTVEPIAKKLRKKVYVYDPKKLKDFATQLLLAKGKTILIVGHSNTTPALANLLLKSESYKAFDETVYHKIIIVQVTRGEAITQELAY